MSGFRLNAGARIAALALLYLAGTPLLGAPDADPPFKGDRFGGGVDAKDLPVAVGGACPAAPTIPADCNFRCKSLLLKSAAPRRIILKQAQVYEDLDLKRPQSKPALAFGNKVTVSHWKQGAAGSHFVRIDTDTGPRCGWIEGGAVLPENRDAPLRISELSAAGVEDFRLRGKGGGLDAKVLVQNDYKEGHPELGKGARVYYKFDDPEPYNTIKIFNVLNVYDSATHDGQPWYFVGGTRVTKDKGEEQVLHGWVRSSEVIPWSTLVNVYYNEGKHGLEIYEKDTEAEAQRNAFARQGDDGPKGADAKGNIPRFPLLETVKSQGGVTLHQIAFPGTACDSKGNCISAADMARTRDDLGGELFTGSNVDFLFVIDATESMVKYFPLVVRAIKEFLDEVDAEARAAARFSIVVYGDFLTKTSGREGFQFARVVPFGSADNRKQLEKLMTAQSFRDNMADLPEAAFGALTKAIKEADWRKDAGWQMTIWIGDHPNRGGSLIGNRDPVYTEADVIGALTPGRGVWAAVNVRGDYRADYNALFVTQAGRVLAGFDKGFGIPPRKAYDAGTAEESPAGIVRAVKDQLHYIMNQGEKVPEALALKALGATAAEIDRALPGAVLARRYVEERLAMTDAQLKDFFQRSQLVRRGFVRQSLGANPDWRYWVSFKPIDMGKIVDASENLCETLSADAPELNTIREAMVAVLKGVTGDNPEEAGDPDETLRVFLAKSTQVPVEQFSDLLDKNIDGFVDWYLRSKGAEKEGYMALMCKKSALLKLAANGQRVEHGIDDLEFNTGTHFWGPRAGTAKPFNWLWKSEQGVGFYYIPLEYIL